MLFRSLRIGRFANIDFFLHWTMWMLPIFILVRGLIFYTPDEAILQAALVFGVYGCLLLHECFHLLVAQKLALALRDVTFYPIGGIARLAILSNRPWKEIWVATTGPLTHVLIAGTIAIGLLASGVPLARMLNTTEPFVEVFFNRLFWLNVFLAILQIVPAFPMDGGTIFRGALALSAGRLRATEVATLLSSFIALLVLIPGMIWMGSVWWLLLLGIVIHVCGQQELMSVRYFASLQNPLPGTVVNAPIMAPIDQLFDDKVRPDEPNFSGIVWNPKNHLWIVWRNGQPISANALVGEN